MRRLGIDYTGLVTAATLRCRFTKRTSRTWVSYYGFPHSIP